MQLHITPHSSSKFTHNSRKKLLTADISDISNKFEQLYDDACDIGIALYNEGTRSVSYWHTGELLKDREGELVGWVLRPTPETMRKCPATVGYTIRILND